jgi:hypothetical protein
MAFNGLQLAIYSLLMSYLAYASNRSFVFEDYVWSQSPLPFTIYDFSLRPSRIPLNAFISGPTAGGPMPDGAPRAVSFEFYKSVCHPDRIVRLSSKDSPVHEEGDQLMAWWLRQLDALKGDMCVVIDSSEKVMFDRECVFLPILHLSAVLLTKIFQFIRLDPNSIHICCPTTLPHSLLIYLVAAGALRSSP